MRATINGEARDLREGITLAELLSDLRLRPDGIAIALNERVVKSADFAGQRVASGDSVEIIRAVAGG